MPLSCRMSGWSSFHVSHTLLGPSLCTCLLAPISESVVHYQVRCCSWGRIMDDDLHDGGMHKRTETRPQQVMRHVEPGPARHQRWQCHPSETVSFLVFIGEFQNSHVVIPITVENLSELQSHHVHTWVAVLQNVTRSYENSILLPLCIALSLRKTPWKVR